MYCDGGKIDLKVLTDLHAHIMTEYENRICIKWYALFKEFIL
jgi:hypothetical protein